MADEISESIEPTGSGYGLARAVGLALIFVGIGTTAAAVLITRETGHAAATCRAATSSMTCSSSHVTSMMVTAASFWGGGALLLLFGHCSTRAGKQEATFGTLLPLCLKLLGLLVFAPGAIVAGLSVVVLWSPAFAGETLAKSIVLVLGLITLVAFGGVGHALWLAGNRAAARAGSGAEPPPPQSHEDAPGLQEDHGS